ncbi:MULTISPECIES: hypothetical protein [Crateriforma]|uniref:Uncharacterized protein n=1 Tax=Crateriforma conspicua TaxID=2527996 RepID=A0A5C6FXL6_9PLAN|nr:MULTISPECIES: hypothetical protein [Crateriforma]QDV64563.1 hypothetical protein Mal65_37230 [Crateriforma conspicua]TWT69960.1 hypothetical protein Pan14r_22570 [Crateriforma conspicua]TWU66068.1 hypothetical protein V7x_16250 [Crateriforma conspicua]
MPKALCLISLVASILVVVLFGADAIMGLAGMEDVAPLGYASLLMDLTFAIFGLILVFLSFTTYREQR